MNNILKAKLIISCDVILEEDIINILKKNSDLFISAEDIANQMLYAFLNPKIEAFNEESDLINGSWDFVCDFEGRLKNFYLE